MCSDQEANSASEVFYRAKRVQDEVAGHAVDHILTRISEVANEGGLQISFSTLEISAPPNISMSDVLRIIEERLDNMGYNVRYQDESNLIIDWDIIPF